MANLFMSYQRGRGAVLAQKRWKNGVGVAGRVTKWQKIPLAERSRSRGYNKFSMLLLRLTLREQLIQNGMFCLAFFI